MHSLKRDDFTENLSNLIVELREEVKKEHFLVSVIGPSAVSKSSMVKDIRAHIDNLGLSSENVETDGFLYSQEVMHDVLGLEPKVDNGFPKSYNTNRIWQTAYNLWSGKRSCVSLYDHYNHNISEEIKIVDPKDVIIFEGEHPLDGDMYRDKPLSSFMDLLIWIGPLDGRLGEEFLARSRRKREIEREKVSLEKNGFCRSIEEIDYIIKNREIKLFREVLKDLEYTSHISIKLGTDYQINGVVFRDPKEFHVLPNQEEFKKLYIKENIYSLQVSK